MFDEPSKEDDECSNELIPNIRVWLRVILAIILREVNILLNKSTITLTQLIDSWQYSFGCQDQFASFDLYLV